MLQRGIALRIRQLPKEREDFPLTWELMSSSHEEEGEKYTKSKLLSTVRR